MRHRENGLQNAREMLGEHAKSKREQRKEKLKDTIRSYLPFLLGVLFGKLLRILFN